MTTEPEYEFNPMVLLEYNYSRKEVPLKEILHKKCIIPAHTMLYRKYKDTKYHENMFFSFDIYDCGTAYYHQLDEIQVWETIKDIEMPYRIIEINGGQIISSLETLYFDFYKTWMPAFHFKKFGHPKRVDFLNRLKQLGDIGWVSSVHDTSSAELFLMNSVESKKDMIVYKESKKINQLTDINSFHSVKQVY